MVTALHEVPRHLARAALGPPAPDSLADMDIVADESVGYIARRVYEQRTGRDLPDLEVEFPRKPLGERWDFDDEAEVARRLPRIFARSGGSSSE